MKSNSAVTSRRCASGATRERQCPPCLARSLSGAQPVWRVCVCSARRADLLASRLMVRPISWFSACAVVLVLSVSVELPAAADELTVLKAARLFDARSESGIRDGVIIVEGTKIKAVGSGLAAPAGAHLVDLGDVTLLPGFIDAHTHLSGELQDDWFRATVEDLRRSPAEQAIHATEYTRRTLLAGFTTVRDVGASDFVDIALRNGIEAGTIPGPRMLVAGNPLGARGGHCDITGYPYMRFGKESGIAEGIASGPDQVRDAVRFQA